MLKNTIRTRTSFTFLSAITIVTVFCPAMPHPIFAQDDQSTYKRTDWDQLFKDYGVTGSITILDYNNNQWIFSDSVDARRETLPASTFKIINSCIALETEAVRDEDEVIKWDGEEKNFFWHSHFCLECRYGPKDGLSKFDGLVLCRAGQKN